jgi:hypothetical protein
MHELQVKLPTAGAQVTTVAAVVHVNAKPPVSIDFYLEDGSKLGGRIIARQWLAGQPNEKEAETEVRCVGALPPTHARMSIYR